jgi:L-glyceraldehyde 3-phosphate reductase
MFDRWIEDGLLDVLHKEGIGCMVFSPLAQGMLTDRYLNGIPEDSRIRKDGRFLKAEQVKKHLDKITKLNAIARTRNQTLAQMSIAWVLRKPEVTSALIGASKVSQIDDLHGALVNLRFTEEDLRNIDSVLNEKA